MNFSDPLAVSDQIDYDLLTVNFTKDSSKIFISQEHGVGLKESTLKQGIPRQMYDTFSARAVTVISTIAQDGSKYTAFLVIAMSILFSQVLKKMTLFYNSALLVFHLPMLCIVLPANASLVLQSVNPAVTYDL